MKHRSLELKFTLPAVAVLVSAVLAGCGSAQRVNGVAANANRQLEVARDQAVTSLIENQQRAIAAQEVGKPFLAGPAVPLERGVGMPEYLRRAPTALFQTGQVDLQTAMVQLSKASGVTISVTPDAMMPASSFAPRTSVAVAQQATKVSLGGIAENTPLWQILDEVCRQAQVSWHPAGAGIEVFRLGTRVYPLAAIQQSVNSNISMGRVGSKADAFTSQSASSFDLKNVDVLKGIKDAVDNMLTIGGRAVLSPDTQSIVVTDTIASHQRIETFIKTQNRALSRRVRVLVEAVEVVAKDTTESGIDWNLIFNGAQASTAEAAGGSPRSLSGELAGGVTIRALSGHFAGSSVILKALSEVGTIVNRRTFPFLTTSGKPVTRALRNTFTYVDQVQATVSTSASTAPVAPTVTQKEDTVGTFITLTPTARSDGQITMVISFEQTTADPLVPFTVGSSTNAVTVQQKSINGTGFVQEIPMRSGQTVVVGGIDTLLGELTQRRLAPGVPILAGGADKTALNRSHMVVLVTAVVEEGI